MRRSRLSFQKILQTLVSGISGVEGAILLEADGESVAWHSKVDGDRLKLRGAYVAVLLRGCEATTKEIEAGAVQYLSVSYEGAVLLAEHVGSGYFVVVELQPMANVGEALYKLKPFVAELRVELDG